MRGLNFESPPRARTKLVCCGKGRLFDVAVDIRAGSPTFGKWFGTELSFENGRQLLVPGGLRHGFSTRELDTEVVYKCTDYYDVALDVAVRFDDPAMGVDWGLSRPAILSDKDKAAPLLGNFVTPFTYEG